MRKSLRGRLWPEAVNYDPAAARRAERCGEIFMCRLGAWTYRWEPLTVHVSQLGKGRATKRDIPGCGPQSNPANHPAPVRPPAD